MPRPAVQLFTLRELDRSFTDVVEVVADLGFEGVELSHAVSGDVPAAEVRGALDRFDLEPVAAHVHVEDLRDRLDEVVDYYDVVGCDALIIPHLGRAHFLTDRRIRDLARELEGIGAGLADRGFSLHYHNSSHDFAGVDRSLLGRALRVINPALVVGTGFAAQTTRRVGVVNDFVARTAGLERATDRLEDSAFYRLVDLVPPDLLGYEVDVGGVATAGFDPVDVIDHLGPRATFIHMHDVDVPEPSPWARKRSVDPGEGSVSFPHVVEAAEARGVEWLVFEHDDPADPIATLERGAAALGPAPIP